VYAGHEHSDRAGGFGGWPIIRNLLWSEDFGSGALYSDSLEEYWQVVSIADSPNTRRPTAYGYVSPGLSTAEKLRIDASVVWNPSAGSDEAEIGITGTAAGTVTPLATIKPSPNAQWVMLLTPRPGAADAWNEWQLWVRRKGSDTGDHLAIHALICWETYADSQPQPPRSAQKGGGVGASPGGSSTVERWFGWPQQLLVATTNFLSSLTWRIIWAWLPGLYEATMGAMAPGAAAQVVRGHDHGGSPPDDAGGWGGLGIPRACVYSGGVGKLSNNVPFSATVGVTWAQIDAPTYARINQQLPIYVSPALRSTRGSYLEAYLFVNSTLGGASIRVNNVTVGAASPGTTLGAGAACARVDSIPCQPGWNWLALEGQRLAGATLVEVYAANISEVGLDAGRHAYPRSQEPDTSSVGGL